MIEILKQSFLVQTLAYFIVTQSNCRAKPSPITNIDDEVNQEVSPFANLLEEYRKAPIGKADEIKGYFIAGLESNFRHFIKRITEERTKADQRLEHIGSLENEKEKCDLYRVLLGIGHRINEIEDLLTAGSNVTLGNRPRDARWKDILNLETPQVQELRKKISDAGLTNDFFASCVQKICQGKNEWVGYDDISIPEALNENILKEVVRMMKIPKYDSYKRAIQILISPLTLPSTTTHKPEDQK